MNELRNHIDEALAYLREKTPLVPEIGIVLGTGLGQVANDIQVQCALDYDEIPHFPVSTVESHHGRLLFGTLEGKSVVVMQGRFHYYEGYSMKQITFPIRVMKFLGVKTLLVSNACGGLNPVYRTSDIMIMDDHINLLGDNPLIGINDDELGPRFPDMSEPYSKRLIAKAEEIALEQKIKVQKGVYVAVAGPNLETRAEYRFLRTIGADVVGMSTIPENIVARHMGMEVFGVSIVTDLCLPDSLRAVDISEILAAAATAEPKLTLLIRELVKAL